MSKHVKGQFDQAKAFERKSFWFWIGDFCCKELWAADITEDDIVIELPGTATFPEVLVLAGIFSSKTEARKNGWGEDRIATFKPWSQNRLIHVADQPGMIIAEGFTFFCAGRGKSIEIVCVKETKPYVPDPALTQGFQDGMNGQNICPFQENTPDWHAWQDGWHDAKNALDKGQS